MLFTSRKVSTVKVAARNVQVGDCLLREWWPLAGGSQHAAEPPQGFAKITTNPGGCAKVVGNQSGVILVVAFFGELEGHAKLSLGRSPFAHRHQAQPARVATLHSDS